MWGRRSRPNTLASRPHASPARGRWRPGEPGRGPCAVCEAVRAAGPSHIASVQAIDAASILRFLSEAEWRLVRQTSKELGGRFGPVQDPSPPGSWGPGQGGAVSEGSVMDEAIHFVKNTIAANLHRFDESFNSSESGGLGDELVRWERSGSTPRHYLGEEVANLEA